MVGYNTIIKVIEQYIIKCSIADIKRKLQQFSPSEKFELLEEKGYLNVGERQDYLIVKENYERYLSELEEAKIKLQEEENNGGSYDYIQMYENHIQLYNGLIEKCETQLFQYERRIVEGHSSHEPKQVEYDISNYSLDEQRPYDLFKETEPMQLEQAQMDKQKKIKFSSANCNAVADYFQNGYLNLNSKLNNGDTWNALSEVERANLEPRMNRIDRNLHEAIGKTDGLLQDTIVFHGGVFDLSNVVGDKIKFKGYLSTSFQSSVAENFSKGDNRVFVYKIALPKGTKGLCANGVFRSEKGQHEYGNKKGVLTGHKYEHEYLLDKGLEFDIVDIDYDNHIVTLMKVK